MRRLYGVREYLLSRRDALGRVHRVLRVDLRVLSRTVRTQRSRLSACLRGLLCVSLHDAVRRDGRCMRKGRGNHRPRMLKNSAAWQRSSTACRSAEPPHRHPPLYSPTAASEAATLRHPVSRRSRDGSPRAFASKSSGAFMRTIRQRGGRPRGVRFNLVQKACSSQVDCHSFGNVNSRSRPNRGPFQLDALPKAEVATRFFWSPRLLVVTHDASGLMISIEQL